MKKHILILALSLITLTSLKSYCQDISGFWTWEEPGNSFKIELEQKNSSSWSGYHSGVFHNGNKIDASIDENSIYLTKVSTNIFEGTIKSSFSLNTHKVRITYNPTNNSSEWDLYGENTGTFYFPRKVYMTRRGMNNRLIGHWISKDDTKWVWDFKTDGKLYSYYEGKLIDTYSYSVETTSPQCGKVVDVGANFSYLKLIDLSDQYSECYEFYSFSDEYIQLRRFDQSKFMSFKKSTNLLDEPDNDFDYGDGDQQILP
jgi:hypothetical protein